MESDCSSSVSGIRANNPPKNSEFIYILHNVWEYVINNDHILGEVKKIQDLDEVNQILEDKFKENEITMAFVHNSIEECEENIRELEFNLNTLSQIQNKQLIEETEKSTENARKRLNKIKKAFLNARDLFHEFLKAISKDAPGITNLIRDLCRGNEYVEVTEENFDNAVLLKRCRLVVDHPYDSGRIKLTDMNE